MLQVNILISEISQANVDAANYENLMDEWGVESIPWVVVLDQSNKVSLSQAPDRDSADTIMLAMNHFPFFIVSPPPISNSTPVIVTSQDFLFLEGSKLDSLNLENKDASETVLSR